MPGQHTRLLNQQSDHSMLFRLQAMENLLAIRRFDPEQIDVVPYRVDARTLLAESSNSLEKYAYWRQVEPILRVQPTVNRVAH